MRSLNVSVRALVIRCELSLKTCLKIVIKSLSIVSIVTLIATKLQQDSSISIIINVKVYESAQQFLDEYAKQAVNEFGFVDKQAVKFVHTPDQDYVKQQASGEDNLGFQPLLIRFANPFTQQTSQIVIKGVNDQIASQVKHFFAGNYADTFEKRFGGFMPDVFDAFTEYDTWEAFDNSWLNREGSSVMHINMPLLFDHISDIDHWTRKQTGEKTLKYQRLLVTTYFTSENKFFRFFIKDVDDAEFERIKLLVQGRLELNRDKVFSI